MRTIVFPIFDINPLWREKIHIKNLTPSAQTIRYWASKPDGSNTRIKNITVEAMKEVTIRSKEIKRECNPTDIHVALIFQGNPGVVCRGTKSNDDRGHFLVFEPIVVEMNKR